jgi:flavorubredoxin
MVITGDEPIIVDTGTIANRDQWMEDVFALVEPADVRWVYLSHDDIDHTGNLDEVMELCPNANLVCSWALVERHTNAFNFPLERLRWLNDGESFDAGDRRLRIVVPPVWDSPTSKGLLDERTGVYWAVDAFACPMPGGPVATTADLDAEFWRFGMAIFAHHALAPWLPLVDPDKYAAYCSRIEALEMSAMASAHAPLVPAASIAEAFRITRELPATVPPPSPGQADLEAIIAAASVPA